jgi:hypothetical protein
MKEYHIFSASRLNILSLNKDSMVLDGENGGLFKEVEIINKQKNIKLILNK